MPDPAANPAATTSGVYRHLPNALTVLRLLIAGAFFVLLTPWKAGEHILSDAAHDLVRPNWLLLSAAVLFVLGALTDALDGALARRWNVETPFGRVMDPFADKVLVVGAFIFLAGPAFHIGADLKGGGPDDFQISGVAPWMVVVALARELLVTSIRGVLEGQGVKFPAGWSGKAKMILQSVTVPAVLAIMAVVDASPGSTGRALILGLVYTTVAVTLLSGVPYVVRAVVAFRRAESSR